jgi:hypothetical protein
VTDSPLPTLPAIPGDALRALWVALRANPTRVMDTPPSVVESLLAWNDHNFEVGPMGPHAVRYALLRVMTDADALCAFDEAQSQMDARDCLTAAGTEALAEELACYIDPTRASEAVDMVDDWHARVGITDETAENLRAAIADNYHIFQRA